MLPNSVSGVLSGSVPGAMSGSGACDFVPGSGACDFVPGSGACDFVPGSGSGRFVPADDYKEGHYDLHVLPDRMPEGGGCSGSGN